MLGSVFRLRTRNAVLYTKHLEYLAQAWRSRLDNEAVELSRERTELRRRVGYA